MVVIRKLDTVEEEEIREMQKRQKELHLIPTPLCYLDIEVEDEHGNVLSKYTDRSKSWTRNFYNWCISQQMTTRVNALGTTYGAGTLAFTNTGGTVRQDANPAYHKVSAATPQYGFRGAAGSNANGIVIGTSNAAESFESYQLTALIAEGTGAGQMSYLAMDEPIPVWDGGGKTMTYTCERGVTNYSGGTINIFETGLIARIFFVSLDGYMLCARDVLSEAVPVPNNSKITVTYSIVITYPV